MATADCSPLHSPRRKVPMAAEKLVEFTAICKPMIPFREAGGLRITFCYQGYWFGHDCIVKYKNGERLRIRHWGKHPDNPWGVWWHKDGHEIHNSGNLWGPDAVAEFIQGITRACQDPL